MHVLKTLRPFVRASVAAAQRIIRGLTDLRAIRHTWMYLIRIVERMEDNGIFLSAAAIAFNALLCIIPIILLLFFVLGLYLDSASAIVRIDEYLKTLEIVPFQKERLLTTVYAILHEFVGGANIAGVIGAIGLVYTASNLFATVRSVLNRIYSVRETRNLLISKLKDFALLSIVGVAAVAVTAGIYGISIVEGLGARLFGTSFASWSMHWMLGTTAAFALTFILLMLVFTIIPDIRLPIRAVLLSCFVAAVLWTIAKVAFTWYITHMWGIGRVYGSYSVAVAFAIWIYYSSITLLFAAEVGEMYVERKRVRGLFRESELNVITESMRVIDLKFSRKQG